eukprot:4915428-Karenia_brevis.AAC.1
MESVMALQGESWCDHGFSIQSNDGGFVSAKSQLHPGWTIHLLYLIRFGMQNLYGTSLNVLCNNNGAWPSNL